MRCLLFLIAALAGCSSSPEPSGAGADADANGDGGAGADAAAEGSATADAEPEANLDASGDIGAPQSCTTRVTYGAAWIHPASHPAPSDTIASDVTWDGTCTDDGPSSYALLSNGWKPYFQGNGACILALDYAGTCGPGVPTTCTTRVAYGPSWLAPAGHPARHDDIPSRVFSDGKCKTSGAQSSAELSNGWTPTFSGAASCRLSFEYTQCGGLYVNPVIPGDCPDPGVLLDGSRYVLTCTSGNAASAFPIYTSTDLATWTLEGHVFPAGKRPAWAKSDFWAPEIHKVGGQYVVYFSARGADGVLAIGVASAPAASGPFTPSAQPLVHDPAMGLIDASEITAGGTPYVLWKEDGNAVGKPTPIHAQRLAADGLSLTGSPSTLISNDQPWEGAVVEGPWMIAHGGSFYLFYSGNSYANATYAVGVARASSPLGPFTKSAAPIVATGGAWVGPGHCSVLDTPAGDTAMVFHAWKAGCVNAPGCGRLVLTDLVAWQNGWPTVPLAPSENSRPLL